MWRDCFKFWPYRDYQGKVVLWPCYTQKRYNSMFDKIEYREREETEQEWIDRAV